MTVGQIQGMKGAEDTLVPDIDIKLKIAVEAQRYKEEVTLKFLKFLCALCS